MRIQPIPDSRLGDPADVMVSRASLRLAFIAALQYLPARQRAVLILRDVLDWPAADVATTLSTSTAAVNSALQRARARLTEVRPEEDRIDPPADAEQRAQVERYAVAFENSDLMALEKLLTEDIVLEMPPFATWYAGRDHYIRFMARMYTLRGTHWRMLATRANGQPGLAAYRRAQDGWYELHTLQVFTVTESGISGNTAFQDQALFTTFGLPARISAAAAES